MVQFRPGARVSFEENTSRVFRTFVGIPQGSSLSPCYFVVAHGDLIACADAHASHLFADDLSIHA